MLRLIKPAVKYKNRIENIFKEWNEVDAPILNPLLFGFNEYLRLLKQLENNKENPMDFFFVLDQEEIIGFLELRYAQNNFNQSFAGHIGYAVRPDKRQLGYGMEILKREIKELKTKKTTPIMLTCDYTHQISKKMFEKVKARYIKDQQEYNERKSIYRLG